MIEKRVPFIYVTCDPVDLIQRYEDLGDDIQDLDTIIRVSQRYGQYFENDCKMPYLEINTSHGTIEENVKKIVNYIRGYNNMINVATILPTPLLETRKADMYHMCLFQVVKHNPVYAGFFKKMVEQGKFVIMDNGAAEGVNPSMEDLLQVYPLVNPSEVVLPDVVYDKYETLRRTRAAYRKFVEVGLHKTTQFMAVPQGNSFLAWCDCLNEMLQQEHITTIGVSKFVTPRFQPEMGSDANVRLECVDMILQQAKKLNREVQIHLLGCWDDPKEVGQIAEAFGKEVRGTDSAIAYVFTRAGLEYKPGMKRPDNNEIDFHNGQIFSQVDLFANPANGKLSSDVRVGTDLLEDNINTWIEQCNNR
jgi:hypothetical protein